VKILKEHTALFSLILLVISFWISIIGAVWGIISLSVFAISCYALCLVVFELCVYGKNEKVRKLVSFFLAMEAVQLIPYAIIFIIREVF